MQTHRSVSVAIKHSTKANSNDQLWLIKASGQEKKTFQMNESALNPGLKVNACLLHLSFIHISFTLAMYKYHHIFSNMSNQVQPFWPPTCFTAHQFCFFPAPPDPFDARLKVSNLPIFRFWENYPGNTPLSNPGWLSCARQGGAGGVEPSQALASHQSRFFENWSKFN